MPQKRGKFNRTHRHGEPIGQGGGGGGGGGGGSSLGERLADITSVSSGADLVKLARAMAKVEIKPQVRAYARLVKELKGQQAMDTIGLERLGQRTQADIQGAANAYDVGAQAATSRTQAVGNALQAQLAQQGKAAAAEQQTAQTGALGGLQDAMSLQGAPQGGQAQAALSGLVSQQAARRAAETQAAGQFATSQQGSYGGLLEGMRTSGGLQASTARQSVGRDIASRIAETRLQSGQDIREALGKKADIKALKGATMLEKLAQLRGEERDYDLGRRATAVDRRGQTLSAASDAASLAETAAHNDAMEAAAAQNADAATTNAQANLEDNGSGGGHEGRQDRRQEARKIANYVRDAINQFGLPSERNHPDRALANLKQYVLSQEGISNPNLVDRVIQDILRRRRQGGGGVDEPPANL